jgi:methylase of polypeptide subunit release factors
VCTYLAALLCRPVTDPAAPPLPPPFVLACDLNPRACAATAATAAANGVAAAVDAVRCDLVGPLGARLAGAVDVLLFNPPYVPSEAADIPAPYYACGAAAAAANAARAGDDRFAAGRGGGPAGLAAAAPGADDSAPGGGGGGGGPVDAAAAPGDGRETAHGGRPAGGSTSARAPGDGAADGGEEEVLDAARERSLAAGAWAGGPDGRVVIDRVLPLVPALLARPGGLMYMVVVDENRWVAHRGGVASAAR